MATIICSHCSQIVSVDDGPVPDQCPFCGGTLQIGKDSTRTGGPQPALPSTVIQAREDQPSAIGRYVVQSKLGGGGFGSVFLAKDLQLDRLVAIKVPRPDTGMTPHALERFAREGRNAAQLRHEGIVPIFNVEHDGEVPFLVCEYVEGETLSDLLRKGPLSFKNAARLVAETATATHHAHEQGIIHRDIKPSNIMIAPDGKPRLMDFGMAKRDEVDPSITVPHAILGTPAYMSPEQAWGSKRRGVDRRSDVYSLGTVLYHLLTREIPFHGEARMVLRQVIQDEPKNPRSLNGEIPLDLETICQKAMQKEPAARYQTAAALSDDLNRWLRGEPIQARPITRFERARSWCRRNPASAGLIASVAVFLLLLAAGSVGMAAVQAAARRNSDNARKEIEEALAKNQELLARAYGERGERHLRAIDFSREQCPIQSLPWMLEAMKVDGKTPDRLLNDRIRLQTLLDSTPSVERMWFFKEDVSAAGISPKRDKFFVVSPDGIVTICKIANEGETLSLGHPGKVRAAAFSPDGTRLATGAVDGLRLWDTDSGKCVKGPIVLPRDHRPKRAVGSDDEIVRTVISKTGRLLFAAAISGVSQVWNAETGEPVGKAIHSQGPPATAEFADSDRVLVLHVGNSNRLYDALTGVEKGSYHDDKDSIVTATVSPDGITVASCSQSGRVVFLDAKSGKATTPALSPDSTATRALSNHIASAFSPDGRLFATGATDGTVRIWDLSDGGLLWSRRVMHSQINEIQFSGDSSSVGIAHMDQKLSILAARSGAMVAGPISIVRSLLSADWASSQQILAVDTFGVARLWNLRGHLSAGMLPLNVVAAAAVSADRRVLAVAEATKTVWLVPSPVGGRLDLANAKKLEVKDAESRIDAIAISGNGSRIAVSTNRLVYVFDTFERKEIGAPLLHASCVKAARFTPSGNPLVCVAEDGQATVWDLDNAKKLYEPVVVGRAATKIDFDRQGAVCAVAGESGVTFWELATGKPTRPGFLGGLLPRAIHFLGEPERILIAKNWQVRIWDFATGMPLNAVSRSQAVLQCVDVSADKSQFLTGYDDGTARLWFANDATPASPPFEHQTPVSTAIIDPTGRIALTTTDDRKAFLWATRSGELLSTIFLLNVYSQFAPPDPLPAMSLTHKPFTFFSADGGVAYLLTESGLLATITLERDWRTDQQIAADVAVRSGTAADGTGGLRTLDPPELADKWRAINHSVPAMHVTVSTPAGAP